MQRYVYLTTQKFLTSALRSHKAKIKIKFVCPDVTDPKKSCRVKFIFAVKFRIFFLFPDFQCGRGFRIKY